MCMCACVCVYMLVFVGVSSGINSSEFAGPSSRFECCVWSDLCVFFKFFLERENMNLRTFQARTEFEGWVFLDLLCVFVS